MGLPEILKSVPQFYDTGLFLEIYLKEAVATMSKILTVFSPEYRQSLRKALKYLGVLTETESVIGFQRDMARGCASDLFVRGFAKGKRGMGVLEVPRGGT